MEHEIIKCSGKIDGRECGKEVGLNNFCSACGCQNVYVAPEKKNKVPEKSCGLSDDNGKLPVSCAEDKSYDNNSQKQSLNSSNEGCHGGKTKDDDQDDDQFLVKFFVVLPTNLLGPGNAAKSVLLKILDPCDKPPNPQIYDMKMIRTLANEINLFGCEVPFSKKVLRNKCIVYKYIIKCGDNKEQEDCYPKVRKAHLQDHLKESEWSQYDCFVMKDSSSVSIPKKIVKFVKSFMSGNINNLDKESLVLYHYYILLPKWKEIKEIKNSTNFGEKFLKSVDAVYSCAKSTFQELCFPRCRSDQMIMNYLKEELDGKEALTQACCKIHISVKHGVPLKDLECNIFQKLLIDVNMDNYNYFCSAFSTEESRGQIRCVLYQFLDTNVTNQSLNPGWLLVVPFLHFLTNRVSVGQPLAVNRDHKNEAWWGIKEVSKLVAIHKHHYKKKMVNEIYMKQLVPLFEVDQLLSRSLLSTMRIWEIPDLIKSEKFQLDACLANVIYFINMENDYTEQKFNIFKACLEGIVSLIVKFFHLNDEFNQAETSEGSHFSKLWEKMKYHCDLTFELLGDVFFKLPFFSHCDTLHLDSISIKMMALMINVMHEFIRKSQKISEEMNKACEEYIKKMFSAVTEQTNSLLKQIFPEKCDYFNMFELMKFCSELLNNKYLDHQVAKDWETFVQSIILNHFELTSFSEMIEIYSGVDYECLSPQIEFWIHDSVVSNIEKMIQNESLDLDAIANFENMKCQDIFDLIVQTIWPQSIEEDDFISFFLTQPLLPKLLKIFSEHGEVLGENFKLNCTAAASFFQSLCDNLISGNIKIKILRKVLSGQFKFKIFSSLLDPINENNKQTEFTMESILKARERDINYYDECCENIRILLSFCDDIQLPDEISSLKLALENASDEMPFSSICDPSNRDTDPPSSIIFKFFADTITIIEFLRAKKNSIIFKNFWLKNLTNHNQNVPFPMSELMKNVYTPTKNSWNELIDLVQSGKISLYQVDEYFDNLKNENNLEKELNILHATVAQERKQQINNYRLLKTCESGAQLLLEIKDKLKLTGDFRKVETVADMKNSKHVSLIDMTDDLVTGCLAMQENIKKNCLDFFVEEKDFVDWLRTSLSDPRQLKVFIDLTLGSAEGQGDLAVQMVSYLHAAVTAYSALIYDLNTKMGYTQFFHLCQSLWKAADADKKIGIKFKHSASQLSWLNGMKSSHGSMGVNVLERVATINSDGIFHIGNISDSDTNSMTFDNVIQLKIRVKKERIRENLLSGTETGNWEGYDYKQLQDLQSKLMLVAGKAQERKESVNDFSRLFDGVTRLAKLYIELNKNGCCLFNFWKVLLYCDTKKSFYAEVSFSLGEKAQRLKGWQSDSTELKVHKKIEALCNFMESCLKEWQDYMQKNRQAKYYLNHFTTKELATLQKEIAKLMNNEVDYCEQDLLHMISMVNHSCSIEDVQMAIVKAFNELVNHETSTVSDYSETSSGEMTWDEFLTKNNDLKMSLHAATSKSIKNLSDDTKLPLKDKLVDVWKTFLRNVDAGFIDHISIEHLGIILENLALLNETNTKKRRMPSHLKRGMPNLILCSETEVWQVVLSLYAIETKSHFLKEDEVLVCNGNTTSEEIEIFFIRAAKDKNGNLYCLVHAEMLDYEIAVNAEKLFNCYCYKERDLQLAIVCVQGQNDHAHIVNVFDQFKVQCPLVDERLVCNYVKNHFIVSDDVLSAGHLDPERCCVRLIKSHEPGVGKTLKAKRLAEELVQLSDTGDIASVFLTISLHSQGVDPSAVVMSLRNFEKGKDEQRKIYHIDISSEVTEGVDYVLFNLLVLGSLKDGKGHIWSRSEQDLYLIESMPLMRMSSKRATNYTEIDTNSSRYLHGVLHLLPALTCWSPTDSLCILENQELPDGKFANDILDQKMDQEEFKSPHFSRPSSYLQRMSENGTFEEEDYIDEVESDEKICIRVLTRFCGIRNPSWAELKFFADFLNHQLLAFENSCFCHIENDFALPNFKHFVVKFILRMSQDFATRSLKISEESLETATRLRHEDGNNEFLEGYQMKRTWETSYHPYLFFNLDGDCLTFMGFTVDPETGDVLDPTTYNILIPGAVPKLLFDSLVYNKVDLRENFDELKRHEKLEKMRVIMGHPPYYEDSETPCSKDPDESYELTSDNVKKMLAIYMRFECNIPVILMGETGCGKTRLVKFLCELMKPVMKLTVNNMLLMKIHGGTTHQNIINKIKDASAIAEVNALYNVKTVLFFDEANSTEAVGLIKEAMCDRTVNGEPFDATNLKLVAACNPYRKHSAHVIEKMEKAGLGYRVSSEKTTDRLGHIPMRHLVYRVKPLPPSMIPLVWDFGQLNDDVELCYIKHMVQRYLSKDLEIEVSGRLLETFSGIFAASQRFMREQKDECSFVSLRDVERCLKVMGWFYKNEDLFAKMDELLDKTENLDDLTRSLVLALGVCYHACLIKRKEYRKFVFPFFNKSRKLINKPDTILKEISACQEALLNEIKLGENIARNQALKENFFMMVICIQLKIPLFLVGKPGSSKSLAKTIVADAMQGSKSKSQIFQGFKSAQMVSYQCSPLSTTEGIVETFKQCAKFQEENDMDKFVSVVVLDEVGLAEDSDKMPLKALHPLLEDGCEGDNEAAPHNKVAFVGISNWSLDPAKMNRGIFVQREMPDMEELILSARGILSSDEDVLKRCEKLLQPLAAGYLQLYTSTLETKEFFGLRDFYSMVKMIFSISKKTGSTPSRTDVKYTVMRNFGGLESVEQLKVFEEVLSEVIDTEEEPLQDNDYNSTYLIKERLQKIATEIGERYLLILTDNYDALNIFQLELMQTDGAVVIFGSSFPKDQEYTQVCRNINRIKICMETGKTVILLNLENLYESLYDVLNQYYTIFGDQRFVDLGLGTQRVKCKVHESFRLIVVAEKKTVYEKFPIPLINRLEKHYLATSSILTPHQNEISEKLIKWANHFTSQISKFPLPECKINRPQPADVFIGFNPTAPSSLVIQTCKQLQLSSKDDEEQILKHCQDLLLQCAVPESIFRFQREKMTREADDIHEMYFKHHKHSIEDFLKDVIVHGTDPNCIFAQVTTHSRVLLKVEVEKMSETLGLPSRSIVLISLLSFGTEQQFCRALRSFLEEPTEHKRILIIQCDAGDQHSDLIACSRYNISNEYSNWDVSIDEKNLRRVVFIIRLPRIKGGCFVGFQGGKWLSYHIDDLRQNSHLFALLHSVKNRSISSLFDFEGNELAREENNMNIDELQYKQSEVNKLIENCIHGAAAKLKSSSKCEALEHRKVKRLEPLLINLRAETGNKSIFLDIMRKRIAKLLKEREEFVMLGCTTWLTDVFSLEAVCNSGTLSHSFVQHLELKVNPILAHIISYCDANFNLDLLESPLQWVKDFWFEIFSNFDVTYMKYSDIHKIVNKPKIICFDVKNYGCGGSFAMKGQLPFSWLIKEQLDKLIAQCKQLSSSFLKDETDVEETFHDGSLGTLVKSYSRDSDVREQIFDFYLNDFVQMSYKPITRMMDEELQLVAKDLRASVLGGYTSSENQEPNFFGLSTIHLTFDKIHIRYRLFAEFVASCPDAVEALHEKIDQISNRMMLDCQALIYCIETHRPSDDELKSFESISHWVDKVKTLTPLIERLFDYLQLTNCPINLDSYKCLWDYISVLQLFVDHMISSENLDLSVFSHLRNVLGENANLKSIRTFEKIERFLETVHQEVLQKCSGRKLNQACCQCKKLALISLPCGHHYCEECFEEIQEIHQNKCCECDEKIPDDFETELEIKGELKEEFEAHEQRMNSFFMALISQLCFTGTAPPDDEVVDKLLSYVVVDKKNPRTRNFASNNFDPSPVVRSFVLQLLLRYKMDTVKELLEKYFMKMKRVAHQSSQIVELSVLCQNCFEDHFCSEGSKIVQSTRRLEFIFESWEDENLKSIISSKSSDVNVQLLQNLALLKYGLSELAEGMYNYHIDKNLEERDGLTVKRLSDCAYEIGSQNEWAKIFIMKQIVHKYSWNVLLQFAALPTCRWLIGPRDLEGTKSSFDHFIICGDDYKSMRAIIFNAILNKCLDGLSNIKLDDEYYLHLALFQLITTKASSNNLQLKTEEVDAWCDFMKNQSNISDKDLALGLLKNELRLLRAGPGSTMEDGNLFELTAHFMVALKFSHHKHGFFHPLVMLMENPGTMVNSYLPTMPQDDIYEVFKSFPRINRYENPTLYKCPNGHPYVIGNCGRAAVESNCSTCGSIIGGMNHRLVHRNTHFNAHYDNTMPGHVLGQPRPGLPQPERNMSDFQLSIIRLFIHISLYMGSCSKNASRNIIRPPIENDNIETFFWNHMKEDVKNIQTALNRGRDDVIVMLHYIIHCIFANDMNFVILPTMWTSKEERAQWEMEFVRNYIEPHLKDIDGLIDRGRNLILKDENLVVNPLMRKIYEMDAVDDNPGICDITKCPAMWKYRTKISVENVLIELKNLASQENGGRSFPLLQCFLEKNIILQELGRLASIYSVQCKLIACLNRRISASEAKSKSIAQFLESLEENTREEFEEHIKDFINTWNVVRPNLSKFDFKGRRFPKEYLDRDFNFDSEIGVLLPTLYGSGICSVAVVHYLVYQQNDILNVLMKASMMKRSPQTMSLGDCTKSHFITSSNDLHSLLLACCNYSFKKGEPTKVEYNYAALEELIIKKFLLGKPFLEINESYINFQEDLNVSLVFAELEKIPQERLRNEAAFSNEFKTLPDVLNVLACLNIVIEFITSIGHDGETSVVEFITQTLKMEHVLTNSTVMRSLQFKHVKSAWIFLSFTKAKLQVTQDQSVFPNVDSKYKQALSEEELHKLKQCFSVMNVELFASVLFEFIVLELNSTKSDESGTYNPNHLLREVLCEFLSSKNLEGSIEALENEEFLPGILVSHCVHVWLLSVEPEKMFFVDIEKLVEN